MTILEIELIKAIEPKLDGCKPSAPVSCSTAPIEEGMFQSDRCKFCGDYYDKIKPYICPDCWEKIKKENGHP